MNIQIEKLAFFGGSPSSSQVLHVGRPNIGNPARMAERLQEILERRWLSNQGPVVLEFERRLAGVTGAKHNIALCNGTIALEIAIRALGMTGEVIVPSWTFVATAHALQWQEITPVFCDVDPDTHNLDPERVAALITPRTTGIIGVHLWGRACAVRKLEELASRHGLKLLLDAAHAFACSYDGRPIGGFGHAEVFSFHATKFINTFEGGAIATNDDDLASRIRLMTNFGFAGYDRVKYIGTNGKMTEIAAAMGLTSLESMQDFVAANLANWRQYARELAGLPGVKLLGYDERERCNFQYVVVEIDPALAGVHRDWLIEILHAENVMARRYFYPGVHRMEPYRSYFPHAGLLLPVSEALAQRVLVLPTGTAIGAAEVQRVSAIIRACVQNATALQRLLAGQQRRVTPDLS
jgi:dTDP-4-amino-4,6-dideoxygalactose transaminase